MAKKRKRKEPAKQAQEFSKNAVEPLDYEKLAQCIAKAIAEERGKRINTYSVTREWMKFFAWPIFGFIIILMGVLGIGAFIMALSTVDEISASTVSSSFFDMAHLMPWLKLMAFFMVSLICLGIAIMAFAAGKEFERENDRQFVVSVFSSMVSLVALIVALVALFRG